MGILAEGGFQVLSFECCVLSVWGRDVRIRPERTQTWEEVGAGWVFEEAEGGGFVGAFEGGSVGGVAVLDFVVFAGGVDDADFAGVDFLVVEFVVGDDFRT